MLASARSGGCHCSHGWHASLGVDGLRTGWIAVGKTAVGRMWFHSWVVSVVGCHSWAPIYSVLGAGLLVLRLAERFETFRGVG